MRRDLIQPLRIYAYMRVYRFNTLAMRNLLVINRRIGTYTKTKSAQTSAGNYYLRGQRLLLDCS